MDIVTARHCRCRVSDVTKYRLLLAFGLFITSLFKRSLDARQKIDIVR